MQSKIFSALLVGAALTAVSLPSVDAAKLDSYRAMMDTHRCTVLYENITPAERLHNRDKIQLSMWAKEDMADAPEYVSRAYRGVLVLNGSEKYEEKAYDDYAKSILTTGGKEFLFTRDLESKKPVYYGNRGKGKVAGTDADIERSLIYGESFGDADVTRVLSILLSPEKKPLGTPRFEEVGAGTLADGMSYEDYRAEEADSLEAVRFYFDGARLTRIASITYRTEGDKVRARKCILRIDRFDAAPDAAYLTLPKGMKEVK